MLQWLGKLLGLGLKLALAVAVFFGSMVLLAMALQAGWVWGAGQVGLYLLLYALASWRQWGRMQTALLAGWFGLFCGAMFFWDKYGGGGQPAPEWLKLLAHWHGLGWVVLVLLFLPLGLVEMLVRRLGRPSPPVQGLAADAFRADLAQFDLENSFSTAEKETKNRTKLY